MFSGTGALVLHCKFLHALPVFVRGGRDHLDEDAEAGAFVFQNVERKREEEKIRVPGKARLHAVLGQRG